MGSRIMLSWSRTRVRVAFFSSRPRHTEYETSFLAAPGKFEVRSAGVLDHSKTVELFSLVAISPQTSRVLLPVVIVPDKHHDFIVCHRLLVLAL